MEKTIIAVIIGAALINYTARSLPLVFLSRVSLPPLAMEWLGFVPAAVLAALVAPEILTQDGHLNISFGNKNLLAALPTLAVALKTKSLAYTVITGMLAMALLNRFL